MSTRHQATPGLAILLLLALLLVPLALAADAEAAAVPGDTIWSRQFSVSSAGDAFTDVAKGPGGVLYAVGITRATEEVSTLVLVKYAADGTRLWTRTYKSPLRAGSAGTAVRVNKWGNVLVAGSIGISPLSAAEGRDMVVLKYSPGGKRLWVRTYDGPAHKDDYPTDMALDGAGTAYVVGPSYGVGTGRDYAALSVRGDGKLRYAVRYAGPGKYDYPNGVAIDSGGNAYVTGTSAGRSGGFAAATLEISHTGHRVWVKRLQYGVGITHGNDVVVKTLGGHRSIYVAGGDVGGMSTGMNVFVARLQASTGSKQALTIVDDGGNDEVSFKLAVDAAGDAVAVGESTSRATSVTHAFVAKVARAGGELWQRQVWLDAVDNESDFQAVALDAAGNVYCGGYGVRAGLGPEFIVVSLTGTNTWRWINTSSGSAHEDDICRALAVRHDAVAAAGQVTRTASGIDGLLKKILP